MKERSPGRGPGRGDALEGCIRDLLYEWGYDTEANVRVRGSEVDVVAANYELSPQRIVVQSKDWHEKKVTPAVIHRLITMAYTTRAHPLLVYNSEVTDGAKKVMKAWSVRHMTTDQLEEDTLPIAPTPTGEARRLPDIVEDTLTTIPRRKPIYNPETSPRW
jgi:hypothetical protein